MRRIVGLFDDHVQAAKVQQDLIQAGIPGSSICLEDKTTRQREKGFWDSMAEFFGAEDADIYQEAADRGGTLVIADVPDERVDMAVSVMQRHNPIDLQRRTETGKWDRFGLAVQRGYEQTRLRDRTP